MDFALAILLRPLLYLILWVVVIYWLLRLFWAIIPDGKVKTFLFKRR